MKSHRDRFGIPFISKAVATIWLLYALKVVSGLNSPRYPPDEFLGILGSASKGMMKKDKPSMWISKPAE